MKPVCMRYGAPVDKCDFTKGRPGSLLDITNEKKVTYQGVWGFSQYKDPISQPRNVRIGLPDLLNGYKTFIFLRSHSQILVLTCHRRYEAVSQ